MNFRSLWLCCPAVVLLALSGFSAHGQQIDIIGKGKYLTIAGGCISCHTDFKNKGQPFSGGAPMSTPFGTFIAPNITPSEEHGIGNWSDADFIRAMREGRGPDGKHYFPAFPFTSYAGITEADLRAMKAYLFTLNPIEKPSPQHDIPFPLNWRGLQFLWKLLFFREGGMKSDPAASAEVNRGAYLVNALGHCGECHTPRNHLGGLDYESWLAGNPTGPENEKIPNITPDPQTGLNFSVPEIVQYLKTGATPDFDFAGSMMADVIAHNTGNLTDSDLKAIAMYLKSLTPVRNAF
ncbi:MAG: cytochrome c [Pseudomonadota bacterium]|nr:cytochrome c [Pseudomonadota bacterium]